MVEIFEDVQSSHKTLLLLFLARGDDLTLSTVISLGSVGSHACDAELKPLDAFISHSHIIKALCNSCHSKEAGQTNMRSGKQGF